MRMYTDSADAIKAYAEKQILIYHNALLQNMLAVKNTKEVDLHQLLKIMIIMICK